MITMAYKKRKKIAKYKDINGATITNLKAWKNKNPNKIYFDSDLEYKCYKTLCDNFDKKYFDFNPETILLYDAFRDFTNLKDGKLQTTSIRKCEYTPDFIINCPDNFTVYIDSKGYFFKDGRLRYKIFQNKIIKDNTQAISVLIKSPEEMGQLCRIIKQEHFQNKSINTANI